MDIHPSPLRHYFIATHQGVVNALFNTLSDPLPEYFHQLRTALKRVRFIRNMLAANGNKHATALFKPYSKLFKEAGVIREMHVHTAKIRQLAQQDINRVKPKGLDKHAIRQKDWPDRVSKFFKNVVPAYREVIKRITKAELPAERIAEHLYSRVYTKFSAKLLDAELHKNRKLLKELLYGCEITDSVSDWVKVKVDLEKAMLLEDAIGDWHDLELMIKQANNAYPSDILKQLQRSKTRERRKITTLSRQLFRKA